MKPQKPKNNHDIWFCLFAALLSLCCACQSKQSTPCDGAVFQGQCVHKGDIVKFGNYPQAKSYLTFQKASIEWIVLDIEPTDGKLLLLSKYVLDGKPYHNKLEDITWEKCSLRTWLNNDFLNAAFNSSEQSSIAATHLQNPDNPYHSINGGNDTEDKVFLLTIADALSKTNDVEGSGKYFHSDEERVAKATSYAIVNGVYVRDDNDDDVDTCENVRCTADWWLRSPAPMGFKILPNGSMSIEPRSPVPTNVAARVYTRGRVGGKNKDLATSGTGVRPALWVKY